MKKGFLIEKTYQKEKSIFCFKMEGEIDENIDIEVRENLLDDCFRILNSYSDMSINMVWLRTILKDVEENSLKIHAYEKGKEKHIDYKYKQLQYCEVKKILDGDKLLRVVYTQPFDFHVSISEFNLGLHENISLAKYSRNIIRIMQEVLDLGIDFPIVQLETEDKILWKLYKLFYKENPDFSKEDTRLKMQTMLCILLQFNISKGYYFDDKKEILGNIMPFSKSLQYELDRIIPVGEVKEMKDPIILFIGEWNKKFEIIGEFVRNYTNNDLSKLIELSTIIHSSKYDLGSNTNVDNVAKSSGYPISDVEESLNLIRKIKSQFTE